MNQMRSWFRIHHLGEPRGHQDPEDLQTQQGLEPHQWTKDMGQIQQVT